MFLFMEVTKISYKQPYKEQTPTQIKALFDAIRNNDLEKFSEILPTIDINAQFEQRPLSIGLWIEATNPLVQNGDEFIRQILARKPDLHSVAKMLRESLPILIAQHKDMCPKDHTTIVRYQLMLDYIEAASEW